jgi:hypothetical protein
VPTSGPVFLGDRRPIQAVAGLDLDPTSGRPRLSYRRAAELFHARTGWTLHQLRHSTLTHTPEDGTNLPVLLAPFPAHLSALPGTLRPPRTRGGRPATTSRLTPHAADHDHSHDPARRQSVWPALVRPEASTIELVSVQVSADPGQIRLYATKRGARLRSPAVR